MCDIFGLVSHKPISLSHKTSWKDVTIPISSKIILGSQVPESPSTQLYRPRNDPELSWTSQTSSRSSRYFKVFDMTDDCQQLLLHLFVFSIVSKKGTPKWNIYPLPWYVSPLFISSIGMPLGAGYHSLNNQFCIQLHCCFFKFSFY